LVPHILTLLPLSSNTLSTLRRIETFLGLPKNDYQSMSHHPLCLFLSLIFFQVDSWLTTRNGDHVCHASCDSHSSISSPLPSALSSRAFPLFGESIGNHHTLHQLSPSPQQPLRRMCRSPQVGCSVAPKVSWMTITDHTMLVSKHCLKRIEHSRKSSLFL
jgi:hypothetical protein